MNDRIQDLAEQAHTFAVSIYEKRLETENASNVFFYKIKDTKFAELIVAECAKLSANSAGYNGLNISDKILKQFGVEL